MPTPSKSRKRSKPLLLASLVPLWGILGIYGIDTLHGTRWLLGFVIFWALLAVAFFAYAVRQAMTQRRRSRGAA